MAGFRISRFGGEIPIRNARKMFDGAARSAVDCDLTADDLRSFRAISTVANISSASYANQSAFVYSASQMFVFINDVDACYGPLQAEDEFKNKVFISSGFQPYPVYTTKEIGFPNPASSYHGAPIAWRKLGVPPPPTGMIVSVSAVPNGSISSLTVQAVDAVDRLVAAAPSHGLEDKARIRIEGFSVDWVSFSGQTYTVTVIDENSFYLNNFDTKAVAEAGASGTGTWEREYSTEDTEDRIYLYTLVTDQGEEGPPSDPSELVSLGNGQTVTITLPTAPMVEDAMIAFKRLYRTVPTSSGEADYYFVAEIPIGDDEFTDTLAVIQLGERIPSINWDMPPAGLQGLTPLPNGMMAGFHDRTLYLCEPYQPHAWPRDYAKAQDGEIVAIAAFSQSLFVATHENQYVGTATDALSMTLTKLDSVEPCISKRACKSIGYGVVYPSPNGLILVGTGGSRNITANVWDEKEWRSLFSTYGKPFAEVHDGRYYLMWQDFGIIFDPTSDTLEISRITLSQAYGAAVDRDEDRLFLLSQSGYAQVKEWNPDGGSSRIETNWRSQTFVMPYPVNMGAFQLFYDVNEGGAHEVDFYADGVLKYSTLVTDQEPRRLPSGYMAREWFVDVRTTGSVQGLYVAETIAELRGAMT